MDEAETLKFAINSAEADRHWHAPKADVPISLLSSIGRCRIIEGIHTSNNKKYSLGFGLEDFFTAGLEYLDTAAKFFEKQDEAVDKQRTPTVSRHNKKLRGCLLQHLLTVANHSDEWVTVKQSSSKNRFLQKRENSSKQHHHSSDSKKQNAFTGMQQLEVRRRSRTTHPPRTESPHQDRHGNGGKIRTIRTRGISRNQKTASVKNERRLVRAQTHLAHSKRLGRETQLDQTAAGRNHITSGANVQCRPGAHPDARHGSIPRTSVIGRNGGR